MLAKYAIDGRTLDRIIEALGDLPYNSHGELYDIVTTIRNDPQQFIAFLVERSDLPEQVAEDDPEVIEAFLVEVSGVTHDNFWEQAQIVAEDRYEDEEDDEYDEEDEGDCPKCGGYQPDGFTCCQCGFTVRGCPYCGGPMEHDTSICPYCGKNEEEFERRYEVTLYIRETANLDNIILTETCNIGILGAEEPDDNTIIANALDWWEVEREIRELDANTHNAFVKEWTLIEDDSDDEDDDNYVDGLIMVASDA